MGKYEETEKKREKRIIALLKEYPQGLTVEDIAKKMDVNRISIGKILNNLVLKSEIVVRKIGKIKLHYHKNHIKNFKSIPEEKV